MNEQKPCPITTEEAANAADVLMQITPQNLQQVKALSAANKVLLWVALLRRAALGNASEVIKNLWALYDKYEDAEHAVCGKAATLLSAAPEAPHGLQTTWDTPHTCKHCHEHLAEDWSYCPECGRATAGDKPMTLKQLDEMDGKPVYIVDTYHGGLPHWTVWDTAMIDDETKNYGETWLAYARKPEQEAAP